MMKKKILNLMTIITVLTLLILPSNVKAATKTTNFKETVAEEITTFEGQANYEEYVNKLKAVDLSNYKESNDKINVYVFRGTTCSYCLKAIAYFSSIVGEYGKYFNLVTYEVWNNSDNDGLMNKVADLLAENVTGVPYIVIGNKSFKGYSETMNADIEAQIKKEYESKNRYDVLTELSKGEKETSTGNDNLGGIAIILEILIAAGLIIYINVEYNKLRKEFEKIKKAKK
jgi:glutaredoxin